MRYQCTQDTTQDMLYTVYKLSKELNWLRFKDPEFFFRTAKYIAPRCNWLKMTIHRFFAANHVYQKETELRKLELMMPQREAFQASYCIKTSYPLRRSPLNFFECKGKCRMIRT